MLYAQELCDNGIDDDGDGLVDCFDGDCSSNGSCDSFFFGNTTRCSSEPNELPKIKASWASVNKTTTSYASPVIGDLDQDGQPEVITISSLSRNLFVLSGQDGSIISLNGLDFVPSNTPLIADVDADGSAEIFINEKNGNSYAMFELKDGALAQLWSGKASLDQSTGIPGIADFDEDGDAEIYYRNEIIDATSGAVLIAGSGNWLEDYVHAPLAIDILPASACSDCAGLELVTGKEIWAVNEEGGTMTMVSDMNDDIRDDIDPTLQYFPKFNTSTGNQWSAISSADYNLDGNLDLLVTGALSTSAEGGSGESTIFLWDPNNSTVQTFSDPSNDPDEGAGRITLEDIDMDGSPNAVFTMGTKLYALDQNLEIFWTHTINTSHTSVTIFDLHGDSGNEVIVKDGNQLLILRGSGNGDNTTSIWHSIPCKGITQEESVVVADIDGDGSVEICIACLTDDEASTSLGSNAEFAQIRTYKGDGLGWVPGRSVWNQYNYYNVNVNDDLTIPQEAQNHSVAFSAAGACDFANGSIIPYPSRVLNTFGSQSTIINEDGCKELASADLDFVGILGVTDLNCFGESKVTFQVTNIGDRNLFGGEFFVSYYLGDPRLADALLLDAKQFHLDQLRVGDIITLENTLSNIPNSGELFVMLNDPGSTPPIGVPFSDIIIRECEVGNNLQSTLIEYASSANEVSASICEGETYQFGSQMLTEAGEYVEAFPDEEMGCQSLTLTLTVNPTYTESVTQAICTGDAFVFGSEILTEAGDYSHTFQSINSCDSVVNLSLTVETLEAQISLSGGVLSVAEIADATYQWINCTTDSPIEGATGASFSPEASGSYAVTVRSATCETTSECFDVIVLSSAFETSTQVFPNPFTEYLSVQLPETATGTFQLIDLSGKVVLQDNFHTKSKFGIPTDKVEKGLYVLEILVKDQKRRIKVIRE